MYWECRVLATGPPGKSLSWLCMCVLSHFNHVRLSVTPWTVAHQVPLSMGFCRQEYWSGLPCPSPGDLPDPGMEPTSLMSLALAGEFFTTKAVSSGRGKVWKIPKGTEGGVSGARKEEGTADGKEPQDTWFPFLSRRCGGWTQQYQVSSHLVTPLLSIHLLFLSLRTLNAGAGKDNLGHRISSVDEETPLAVFLVLHSSPFALTKET